MQSFKCGLGLIKVGSEYYYTDCCGNFITGFNNTGSVLEVTLDYGFPRGGVGLLSVTSSVVCSTPTPTPTQTVTPTNTVTPSVTPTSTQTPTPSITPSITPSKTPVTRLKNSCDVVTLFDMGISCNVIQNPSSPTSLDGIISVNVTGGTAPYSYFWAGGQRTQTLVGVPQGIYEVVVTDFRWPDGAPDGTPDFTATTICELIGPTPTQTPTMTPTPSSTPPPQCVEICMTITNPLLFGPAQFVCNGVINGQFSWTSTNTGKQFYIIWNPTSNRFIVYQDSDGTTPFLVNGSVIATEILSTIPLSGWQFYGGQSTGNITVTSGVCPQYPPLSVTIISNNNSCRGITNCDGAITVSAQGGLSPYLYSINNGVTTQTSPTFNNLCPNNYIVTVYDSIGNSQSSTVTIGYDSNPVTYQLSLANVGPAITTSVPNVSQTVIQEMTLVVNPPLPVGVSVTFDLLSTALLTVNGPGNGGSSVNWSVSKNGQPVNTIVGPTTQVSQGTRPNCSPNTQIVNSIDFSSSITITNGDVVNVTSTTVDTISNGQVASQTNCTTNIITQISSVISTPTITGNNCSSVLGGSRQVQINDFTFVPVSPPVVSKTQFISGDVNRKTNSLGTTPMPYGTGNTGIIISGSPNDNLTVQFSLVGLNSLPGITTVLGSAFTESNSSTFNVRLDSSGIGRISGTTNNTSINVYGQKIIKFEILSSSNNTPIETRFGLNTAEVSTTVVPPNGTGSVWNGVSSISATTNTQSCSNFSQTNSYVVNVGNGILAVGQTISNSVNTIVNGNNNWITITLAPSFGSVSPIPVPKYSVQVNSLGVITNVITCT